MNCLRPFHQQDRWNAFLNWMILQTSFLLVEPKKNIRIVVDTIEYNYRRWNL
ncbi:MAG: hypothetical protein QCI00_07640 [Candidatus Thermoplasmatota archaeon]|nr:hypothetical protein [Candidatus Thermoplasmatota archaeon]